MMVRCISALRPVLAGAILLALAVCAPAARAQGAEEVFTVRDVVVDVTTGSAAAAREQAILQAQSDAWNRLVARLALPEDAARAPKADSVDMNAMVEGFEVQVEASSAVRYVGTYTVRFRPQGVRSVLQSAGVPYAEVRSKPLLILPVDGTAGAAVLWERETPWRAAWEALPPPDGLVPILVPLGDLQDVADITVADALANDVQKLQRIADRYGAGAVAVIQAGLDGELTPPSFDVPTTDGAVVPETQPIDPATTVTTPEAVPEAVVAPQEAGRPRGLTVVAVVHRFQGTPTVHLLELPPAAGAPGAPFPLPSAGDVAAAGTPPAETTAGVDPGAAATDPALPLAPPPGVAEKMPEAVNQLMRLFEREWIAANQVQTGQRAVLRVSVPLSGLDEWTETRRRLGEVPTVTQVEVLTLGRGAVMLDLHYLGDPARLRMALAQLDLLLSEPAIPSPGVAAPTGPQPWLLQWRGSPLLAPATPAPTPSAGEVAPESQPEPAQPAGPAAPDGTAPPT